MRPDRGGGVPGTGIAEYQQYDDSHQAAERRRHDGQFFDMRPVVLAPRAMSSAVRRHRPKHHYAGEYEHRAHRRDGGKQA